MIKKVVTMIITLTLIAALTGCNAPSDVSGSTALIESETTETTGETHREIVFDGSEGFSLETIGEAFTNEELEVLARKRYLSYAGEVPDKVETFKEIGDTVYIGFYWQGTSQSDSDFWLVDFYRVDRFIKEIFEHFSPKCLNSAPFVPNFRVVHIRCHC